MILPFKKHPAKAGAETKNRILSGSGLACIETV
jgi:hypothetical protein